jgi:hypothetical protein
MLLVIFIFIVQMDRGDDDESILPSPEQQPLILLAGQNVTFPHWCVCTSRFEPSGRCPIELAAKSDHLGLELIFYFLSQHQQQF